MYTPPTQNPVIRDLKVRSPQAAKHLDGVSTRGPKGQTLEIVFKTPLGKELLLMTGLNTHGVNINFRQNVKVTPQNTITIWDIPIELADDIVTAHMMRYGRSLGGKHGWEGKRGYVGANTLEAR